MPKYKVVISLGVHTTIIDAKNEDEATEKAGDEMIALLEGMNTKDIVEIYEATPEDITEFEKEKVGVSS